MHIVNSRARTRGRPGGTQGNPPLLSALTLDILGAHWVLQLNPRKGRESKSQDEPLVVKIHQFVCELLMT